MLENNDIENISVSIGDIVKELSNLTGIDEDKMRNELTPKELIEIVKEFWKMNELESFFDQMKPIITTIGTLIGFKGQLQSVSK